MFQQYDSRYKFQSQETPSIYRKMSGYLTKQKYILNDISDDIFKQ